MRNEKDARAGEVKDQLQRMSHIKHNKNGSEMYAHGHVDCRCV